MANKKAEETVVETIDIKSLNIFEKMALATSDIGRVRKNIEVSTGKSSYKAVSEVDVLDAVKPAEEKYRIYSYPTNSEIIDQQVLTQNTYGKNGEVFAKNSFFFRLEVTERFVNIDNPSEYIDVKGYGDGIDTGDKGTGKALTYAVKNALVKAYKISTGDDPDYNASQEYDSVSRTKPKITKGQIDEINSLYDFEGLEGIISYYKVATLNDLTADQADFVIRRGRSKK